MSIVKRSVYFDTTDGIVRFLDWALTQTTIGVMAEPFSVDNRHNFANFQDFDPTDEVHRIDSLHAVDACRINQLLSGGDHALNGGVLNPRVGK